MSTKRRMIGGYATAAFLAAALAVLGSPVAAQDDDISGVVTSAAGPEAGVWVIAETQDFDTGFRKIVVTDDDGRFLVPDLPGASYEVWVRGYGLADSEKTAARPGDDLALTATEAASPHEAAEIYPANYWYSLLEVPPASDFPGTGPRGNGIGVAMRTQADWVDRLKDGCQLCHQLGNKATREMPMLDLDDFDSAVDAWEYRLRAGGAGPAMAVEINRMGRPRALQLYADWSDRIAAGELPPVPPRPQGRERNLVLSMWKWGHPRGMVHDEITTDKRNPTLNANGPIYGVGGAGLVITDPRTHTSVRMDLPTRIERPRSPDSYQGSSTAIPSLYWGDEPRPNLQSRSAHNPMLDDKGRLWITQAVRPNDVPDWCLEGSDHPFAQYYPIQHRAESRQVSYYDPETGEFELIDTCYFTHHLQFADDEDDTLWLSGSTEAIGWLNTRLYDETGDERASQGWCPTVIDTNGDGVITKPWNEPDWNGDVEIDPARDTRIGSLDKFKRAYGVIPHPGRIGLDHPALRRAGTAGSSRSRRQPARNVHLRGLRAAVRSRRPERVGLRTARHRRGSQRRDLDGARRQRPPRQLRPQQVRGAERADGHRPALPRGMDAVSDARTDVQGVRRFGERRLPLLQLGRPVRHARPRREHAHRDGHDVGCAPRARSGQRRVGDHARPVSARLLQPGASTAGSTIRPLDGRVVACGRASTPGRRSTSKGARGPRARSSGSRYGRIRWRTRGSV